MFDLAEQHETTGEALEQVADGDILSLSWKGRIEDLNRIVDKTDEPTVVIVGKGHVIPGIEEILPGMTPGETKTVVLPPEKGYGKRDRSKIQVMSLRRFKKQNINPQPGMRLRVQNRIATIRSVHGGRVTVDFNHPLAGKTLSYEVSVEAILRDPGDITKAFIKKYLPKTLLEEFTVTIEEDTVIIQLPRDETLLFRERLQFSKAFISSEIIENLDGISTVKYIEIYPVPVDSQE